MLWIGNGVKLSHAADEVTRLQTALRAHRLHLQRHVRGGRIV
ncbi:MAG: hypothetical protein ACLVL7_01730 [Anaerotruncus massiliensis (ex Togo et al. 2019)]